MKQPQPVSDWGGTPLHAGLGSPLNLVDSRDNTAGQ